MVATSHRVEASLRGARDTCQWLFAGSAAGLVMVAIMLTLRVVSGEPSLPELVQDWATALIPAPLFSFVLDRLQFTAKPLLLVGLAFLQVPVGAGLGWVYGRAWPRQGWLGRQRPGGGVAYGLLLWVILELGVAASADGASPPVAGAGSLLASSEAFGLSLVGLARLLQAPAHPTSVDQQRRAVVFGGATGAALVLAGGGLARLLALNTEQATLPELRRADHTAGEPTPTAEAVADLSATSADAVIPPGVAEEVTPSERFYLVSKNFNDPRVAADAWSVEVSGLVDHPRKLTYDEILALPTESSTPRWSASAIRSAAS